jgi:hypothetical protein
MAEGARYLEAPKGLVSLLSLNLANKIVSDAFYKTPSLQTYLVDQLDQRAA